MMARKRRASRERNRCALMGRRLLEGTQIVGHIGVFRGERFYVAEFNVDFLYAGPFGARTEKPPPLPDNPRSVKRIAGDEELNAFPRLQIRTDNRTLACSIFVQHKNFNRIAQVTVIKLIVSNPMESHGRIRRHHEIQGRPRGAAIKKWRRKPSGRNLLVADKRDPYEPARGVRLEIEQCADLFGC